MTRQSGSSYYDQALRRIGGEAPVELAAPGEEEARPLEPLVRPTDPASRFESAGGYGWYPGQTSFGIGDSAFGGPFGGETRGERQPSPPRGDSVQPSGRPVRVADVMTASVPAVRPHTSLREIATLMRDTDTTLVPVVNDDGKLVGVIQDHDMVVRAYASGKAIADCRAEDVADDEMDAVLPDEPLESALETMTRVHSPSLPVVDRDDRLLGLVSLGAVAARAEYDDSVQQTLGRAAAGGDLWSSVWP